MHSTRYVELVAPRCDVSFDGHILDQVAMKLFIDNVPTVVTEVTLLNPLLSMFGPKVVCNMNSKDVERIAAESEEKRSKREVLIRKLEVLREGRTTCRLYAERTNTGTNASPLTFEMTNAFVGFYLIIPANLA